MPRSNSAKKADSLDKQINKAAKSGSRFCQNGIESSQSAALRKHAVPGQKLQPLEIESKSIEAIDGTAFCGKFNFIYTTN